MPVTPIVHTSNTSVVFSTLLHALILFGILSALFVFVISKLEKSIFEKEINDNVNNILLDNLHKLDKDGSIKKMLKQIPLDRLVRYYDKPSSDIVVYNDWLQRTMIFFAIAVGIILIISALFLYFTCGQIIPLWSILLENLVIFSLVGMFEAVFFLNIASKYIPVPPSLLVTQLFDDLKNWK
jgi:hypothetical protein